MRVRVRARMHMRVLVCVFECLCVRVRENICGLQIDIHTDVHIHTNIHGVLIHSSNHTGFAGIVAKMEG